jgi:hypothetical protein
MSDYTYWQNALKGEFGPVHDGDAQPGFWRKRTSRAGPFVPVAIWEADGKMVALVDGKESDPAELWTYVCRYPILEEWYHSRLATGKWPDEDAGVAESLIGDNNPPQDEADTLKGQIEAASANVAEYAEINDDETASKAQSARSRLLELSREADTKRETAKKPHFDAAKAVDARWQPLVKMAKAAADALAAAIGGHETRKLIARRKAEDDAKKAAEKAAAKAPKGAPPPQPAPSPPPAEVSMTVRGAYGRAGTKKMVKVAVVDDQDKAYEGLKRHPDLIEFIRVLAQRAVEAGVTVPGVSFKEEVKIR